MIRVLRAVLLVGGLTATAACTHLEGQRLSDGRVPAVVPKAIPFPLMRPQYTLALVPPADDTSSARYTINVTYEADPTQWYSLKLNPALLSDPSFKLYFNTNNSLKTVNASTAEQITPTIKAIGSFAASLIGAAATGALKTADPRDVIAKDIHPTTPRPAPDPCMAKWDYVIPAGLYPANGGKGQPALLDVNTSVGDAIIARMRLYNDEATFEAKIHYATPGELACFRAAQTTSDALTDSVLAAAQTKYDASRATYQKNPAADPAFESKVDAAIETTDPDLLKTQKAAVKSLAEGLQADADKLQVDAGALIDAKTEQSGGAILKMVAEMPGTAWRARHVIFLEDELDRISLIEAHLLSRGPAQVAALQNYRRTLYDGRALTVGAMDLRRRAEPLRAFLSAVPTKPVARGFAPAAQDYAVVRLELDELEKRIQAKRDAVVAAADPPKPRKSAALTDAPLMIITQMDIDASRATGWSTSVGKPLPTYALLLTDPSSPPAPAPAPPQKVAK